MGIATPVVLVIGSLKWALSNEKIFTTCQQDAVLIFVIICITSSYAPRGPSQSFILVLN